MANGPEKILGLSRAVNGEPILMNLFKNSVRKTVSTESI